jgi:hypothetical protein
LIILGIDISHLLAYHLKSSYDQYLCQHTASRSTPNIDADAAALNKIAAFNEIRQIVCAEASTCSPPPPSKGINSFSKIEKGEPEEDWLMQID